MLAERFNADTFDNAGIQTTDWRKTTVFNMPPDNRSPSRPENKILR
jgi:hypothetical protein